MGLGLGSISGALAWGGSMTTSWKGGEGGENRKGLEAPIQLLPSENTLLSQRFQKVPHHLACPLQVTLGYCSTLVDNLVPPLDQPPKLMKGTIQAHLIQVVLNGANLFPQRVFRRRPQTLQSFLHNEGEP